MEREEDRKKISLAVEILSVSLSGDNDGSSLNFSFLGPFFLVPFYWMFLDCFFSAVATGILYFS